MLLSCAGILTPDRLTTDVPEGVRRGAENETSSTVNHEDKPSKAPSTEPLHADSSEDDDPAGLIFVWLQPRHRAFVRKSATLWLGKLRFDHRVLANSNCGLVEMFSANSSPELSNCSRPRIGPRQILGPLALPGAPVFFSPVCVHHALLG